LPDSQGRLKIVLLSDSPLVPSGVGTQAKLLIEGLLETGKYSFFCLGGAISHPDYNLQCVAPEKYGEATWLILPVKGHGDKNILRQVLREQKPDAVVMFTDPRFFYWVWEMEDEVRSQCPLLYWHVWDNDPTPEFNRSFYEATDFISCLSLKTYGLLQDLGYPKDRFNYIPHSLHEELFKPLDEAEVQKFKAEHFGPHRDKEFVVAWNNRNARRKQPGDVIESFAKFLKRNPAAREKSCLFMHTQPSDPEGQNLIAVASKFGVDNLIISDQRVDAPVINWFYNVADVVVNIASNEGFGLGTLEALYAGTPIITHMTGGLQFQIGDWWKDFKDFSNQEKMTAHAKKLWSSRAGKWWGVPVFPAVRNCVGGQPVPYIYDDRASNDDVAEAIEQVYEMSRDERKKLGRHAREWAIKTFSRTEMISSWDNTIQSQVEAHASARSNRSVGITTL
jgi:glycosyltransferase involved in cell wall biosynthesis